VFANKIIRVQACIDVRGHHFQHLLQVHNDFQNADLPSVFANKIKRVQACIDARGHHFLKRFLIVLASSFTDRWLKEYGNSKDEC
jgi:hypothetical protein